MIGELGRLLNATDTEIADVKVAPGSLCAMISLIEERHDHRHDGQVGVRGDVPTAAVQPATSSGSSGWSRSAAQTRSAPIVDKVIAANPKPVADYRAGKQEAIKFLVGQVMRETKGRANPAATLHARS